MYIIIYLRTLFNYAVIKQQATDMHNNIIKVKIIIRRERSYMQRGSTV